MKFKLPSLTISLLALILMILIFSMLLTHKSPPSPMSATQAETCVDCVHYVNRVNGRVKAMQTVDANPQFFRYALDKSCRGQMYLNGHCTRFRREFRKDIEGYMQTFPDNQFEACVRIKACN